MQVKKKKKNVNQAGKIPEEAERMKPYGNKKTRIRENNNNNKKKKKKRHAWLL